MKFLGYWLIHKNKKVCNHLRKEDAIYGGRRVELRGVQYILNPLPPSHVL